MKRHIFYQRKPVVCQDSEVHISGVLEGIQGQFGDLASMKNIQSKASDLPWINKG